MKNWRKLKEKNLQNGFIQEDVPAQIYIKECPQCFKTFPTYFNEQVYCDKICRKKAFDDIQLRSLNIRQEAKEKIGSCEVCGYNKWFSCLEWHHVYPETKEYEISAMKSCSEETIEQELKKCILLCCNCHQEIHRGNVETQEKVFRIMEQK